MISRSAAIEAIRGLDIGAGYNSPGWRAIAIIEALDAQPDITRDSLKTLIDGLFLDTDTAVEMRRFGAEELATAILLSLKGGE